MKFEQVLEDIKTLELQKANVEQQKAKAIENVNRNYDSKLKRIGDQIAREMKTQGTKPQPGQNNQNNNQNKAPLGV